MKRTLLLIALVLSLAACTKTAQDAVLSPNQTKYFSRVRYFSDGRQPATDTVMTIQVSGAQMEAAFAENCGKLYTETTTYRELGVCWTR
jgi:hypothetical protein